MAISLLPLLWELEQPLYMQQRLNYGLTPKELATVTTTPRERDYSRPWHEYYAWKARLEEEDIEPDIKKDKKKFEISLPMRHFTPEEISVKAADGYIKIEAVQERRNDHGVVTRHFVRSYELPDGCNEDAVESRVSPDGILTVTAPVDDSPSRTVPILLQRQADLLEHYNTFRGEKEPVEKEAMQKESESKEPEPKEPKVIAPENEDSKKKDSPPQTQEPEEEEPMVKEPKNEEPNQNEPEEKEPQEEGDVEDQQ